MSIDYKETKLARLRTDPEGVLILDVYDVDQYGRLLANVRGVRVGAEQNILARRTLAEECVAAGWAFTTPLHILPDCVDWTKRRTTGPEGGASKHLSAHSNDREQINREGRRRVTIHTHKISSK